MADHAYAMRHYAAPDAARPTAGADRARLFEPFARASEARLASAVQLLARRSEAAASRFPPALVRAAGPNPEAVGRPNRAGLPDRLKAGIEALSGLAMDDVRVHSDSPEPAQLAAHAFARGSEIHLAPGQQWRLPHEAWHIVQQKQGRVRPTEADASGIPINADPGLEAEADRMGAESLAGGLAGRSGAAVSAAETRPAPAAVAQCWLDPTLLAGRTRDSRTKALATLALAYNSNRKGKTRQMRIDQLEAVHVAALGWLNDFDSPDQNQSPAALWVKDLLNDIQREHQELVRQSIQADDEVPPVANFDALTSKEQAFVKRTWTQLVEGTGNVQISETEDYSHDNIPQSRQHPGFRFEALAQFARLLNSRTGRDIVAQVNADTGGERLVTIVPSFAVPQGNAPGQEFAASPTVSGPDKLIEVDVNAKFKGVANGREKKRRYLARFVDLNLRAIQDPKARAAAIYAARRANPGKIGIHMAGKYYLFGAGTAVTVTMTRDIRDAEDHHTSRLVDEQRHEIPAPNFITLGHELGHASHMMTGVALGDDKTSEHLLSQMGIVGRKQMNWSNMEEYANINSVENALRADYGLKPRFGHINQSVVQKKRIDAVTEAFFILSDLQPQPNRNSVEQHLGRAGMATGALKIADARDALAAAAKAFSRQLATVFPKFTTTENAAIRKEMTDFQRSIRSPEKDVVKAAGKNVADAIQLVTAAKARVQQAAQVLPPPPKASWPWSMFGY